MGEMKNLLIKSEVHLSFLLRNCLWWLTGKKKTNSSMRTRTDDGFIREAALNLAFIIKLNSNKCGPYAMSYLFHFYPLYTDIEIYVNDTDSPPGTLSHIRPRVCHHYSPCDGAAGAPVSCIPVHGVRPQPFPHPYHSCRRITPARRSSTLTCSACVHKGDLPRLGGDNHDLSAARSSQGDAKRRQEAYLSA